MTTISLCMIVKNEEMLLKRCLESVRGIPDEIIIVDTGSADHTKKIAKEYTDQIYNFEWIDDFSAARNYSFNMATKEYVMWLDADDVIFQSDYEKLRALKESLDPSIDAVFMPYCLAVDARDNPVHEIQRNRLVKRSRSFKWHGVTHEDLEVKGRVMISDIRVFHKPLNPDLNLHLRIYDNLYNQGKELEPRDLMHYGNDLFRNDSFQKATEIYSRLLDSKKGSTVEHIIACRQLALCYEQLSEPQRELHYLLKSLEFDTPRAEICCLLGRYFGRLGKLNVMRSWFKLATLLERPNTPLGALDEAYRTWFPHKQLAFFYCQAENYEEAHTHAQKALALSPSDEQLQHIKGLLDKVMERRKGTV